MDPVLAKYEDLLIGANIGHLATVRPDGSPTVTPMWFLWDGEHLRFTHTTRRAKLRNLERVPFLAMSVVAASDPYRYVEVRAKVERIDPDPTGAFYVQLSERYGPASPTPPDAADRIVIVATPVAFAPASR